jgi:glycosyltransferase involved in cell wall biosynthesis
MPRPMNVIFPPIGGDGWMGGQNYLGNLITQILTYCPNRVRPILCVPPDYAPEMIARLENVGAVIVHDPMFARTNQQARMIKAIITGSDQAALSIYRKYDADLLFENATYHGWRFPIPALSWVPDFQHRHMPQLFSRRAYWRREIGFLLSFVGTSHIMLSSKDARADFDNFYRRGKTKTYVVPFAVPAPPAAPPEMLSNAVAEYNLPKQWVFLPNQFWQHKNHAVVIDALAIAAKSNPEICVVCTGAQSDPRSPGHFQGLMNKVALHGLERNFRVLGLVPYGHVGALMQNALALLNPSKFEGWSTVVEEAKAIGKPLILSDIGVHREQTGNQARYFGADKPELLAQHLLETFSGVASFSSVVSGDAALCQFVENFASAAEHAAGIVVEQVK